MDRKKQILEEATKLFSEYGYDKVTIKTLAEACGITEPALYRHYESKEAIYDRVLDSIEERLSDVDIFSELGDETDLEKFLMGFAGHIIDFYSTNKDLYRLLLFSALREHPKAKRVYEMIRGAYIKFLIRKLDSFYQAGIVIEKNNEITARCFTGMVFDCALGVTLWKNYHGKQFPPADVIANNIPIYVRGLKQNN